jgi:HAD superfamily hydrolase (TIGR01490 family)
MNSPHPNATAALRPAAIFDVDGTLCATRSTTSLVWLRSRQHGAWRHRLWLASLAWRAPLAMVADAVSRQWADRLVYAQYGGLSRSRAAGDAQRCCDELLLPACFPAALAEIDLHRRAGRRIVLLSGGVDLVLAPLAAALGAELLAQRIVADGDRLTGAYLGYAVLDGEPPARSQGESKAQALQRYAQATGIDLPASSAYGDSVNDAGMLAAVGHAVAVNPDRKLARIARARGWDMRAWR